MAKPGKPLSGRQTQPKQTAELSHAIFDFET
jgi:hypothetical protein